MKVYIGKYTKWWGPYQLAELVPFLNKDQKDRLGEYLGESWVGKACVWVDSHKKRKEYVRIDRYDTWSMDHTLSLIILPMLKQLRDTKCGSPLVDDEDVPTTLRYGDENGCDNWVHYKWEWILNEMIWTFENIADNSWEMKFYENGFDSEGYKEYNDRINNGLRLFGKYYRSLWD